MLNIFKKVNQESFLHGHNWIALVGFSFASLSLLFAVMELYFSDHPISHWFSDFGEFTFYIALFAIPLGGIMSWKYIYPLRYLGLTVLSLIIQLSAFFIILDMALGG